MKKLKRRYNKYLASSRCKLRPDEFPHFKLARIWKLNPLYDANMVERYVVNILRFANAISMYVHHML